MAEKNKDFFVRTELLEPSDPPALSINFAGWLRANLFSNWYNSILTFLSLGLILWLLWAGLPWVFLSVWNATSLSECREISFVLWQSLHGHACWAVINERWEQFLFGFYPSHLYWRPILALLLLGVALAPILFDNRVPRKLLIVSIAYPFVMPWLIWGGSVWTPILVFIGFICGYGGYRVLRWRGYGSLMGVLGFVFVAFGWWYFGMGFVSGSLEKIIANVRLEARFAHEKEIIDRLSPELEILRQEQNDLKQEIRDIVAVKKEAFSAFEQKIKNGALPDEPHMIALKDDFFQKMSAVYEMKIYFLELSKQVGKFGQEVRDAKLLHDRIENFEANKDKLQTLVQNIKHMHSSLRLITDEKEKGKLSKAIKDAEKDYVLLKQQIGFVYEEVGRVGLEKVTSRSFGGFMLSILIGIVAIGCSLPIGILLALGRRSDLYIIKYICIGFIEFFRGVPLITLLLIASTLLNIFLPPGTVFDIISRVIIMVTIFSSAYIAEVVRGGLAALGKGQYEGADSLGLSYWQSQYLIIMPQALKISIPGIVSTFIGVFKDTTLVLIIGLLDPLGLTNTTRASSAWNGVYWELFVFIAIPFFIICFSMSRYSMYLERKLKTDHH